MTEKSKTNNPNKKPETQEESKLAQPSWANSYKHVVQEDGPRDNSHGMIQDGINPDLEVTDRLNKAAERVKSFLAQ